MAEPLHTFPGSPLSIRSSKVASSPILSVIGVSSYRLLNSLTHRLIYAIFNPIPNPQCSRKVRTLERPLPASATARPPRPIRLVSTAFGVSNPHDRHRCSPSTISEGPRPLHHLETATVSFTFPRLGLLETVSHFYAKRLHCYSELEGPHSFISHAVAFLGRNVVLPIVHILPESSMYPSEATCCLTPGITWCPSKTSVIAHVSAALILAP